MGRARTHGGFRIELRSLAPWLVLGAVLILATCVRLYNLEDIPPGMWYDEADNLLHAQRYAHNPGQIPVYEPSTNLPSLFLLPISALVKLVGTSVTAPRLVAVAFGVAGIVATFLFVRHMFGVFAGLIAAFFVAFMRWDIIWSRIGMHGVTGVLFAALTGCLTLRALRSGRYSDYAFRRRVAWAGNVVLRLVSYVPARGGLHADSPSGGQTTAAPQIRSQYLPHGIDSPVRRRPTCAVRSGQPAGIFRTIPDYLGIHHNPRDQWVDQIDESLREHLLMFNRQGDPNPRHNLPGEPMLDFVSGGLFVLGFFFALTQWRNTGLFTLPFWVLLMLLPGVLTVPWESPQSLRSIVVIPAVAALAAYPLERLWWVCKNAPWPAVRRFALPGALGALGFIAYVNVEFLLRRSGERSKSVC